MVISGKVLLKSWRLSLSNIFIGLLVLFVPLMATLMAWQIERRDVEQQAKFQFLKEIEEYSILIKERVPYYLAPLRGLQGLFAASKNVERDEWEKYVKTLNLEERYQGLSALNFIRYVKQGEKAAFVEFVRVDTTLNPQGYPDFHITSEGDRDEYYVAHYLYPFDSQRHLHGIDLGADSVRRQMFLTAGDEAAYVATPKTTLYSDPAKTSFLICLPVYANNVPATTLEERRAALYGFIFGIFESENFFKSIFADKKVNPDIDFYIFDSPSALSQYVTEEHLLYKSGKGDVAPEYAPRFTEIRSLEVAGQTWNIQFYARPGFQLHRKAEMFPSTVLAAGLVFTVLFFGVYLVLILSQSHAVSMARVMTAKLRESEEHFRSVTQSANDAIISSDQNGKVVSWNQGAEKMFGYNEEETSGKSPVFLMPKRFRAAYLKGFSRFLKTGEGQVMGRTVEFVGLRKDQTEFPIELSLSNWKTAKGVFFTVVIRNITEQKLAKEVLIQQADRLTRSNAELEVFNRLAVGRELKMIELKRQINELYRSAGRVPPYSLSAIEGGGGTS